LLWRIWRRKRESKITTFLPITTERIMIDVSYIMITDWHSLRMLRIHTHTTLAVKVDKFTIRHTGKNAVSW
jgi:hypothetical protein